MSDTPEITWRPLADAKRTRAFLGEAAGKFLVKVDESALGDFLDGDALDGLALTRVYTFESDEARAKYLRGRGWSVGA